jgi:hypothetical protein
MRRGLRRYLEDTLGPAADALVGQVRGFTKTIDHSADEGEIVVTGEIESAEKSPSRAAGRS